MGTLSSGAAEVRGSPQRIKAILDYPGVHSITGARLAWLGKSGWAFAALLSGSVAAQGQEQ